jgi:integrase
MRRSLRRATDRRKRRVSHISDSRSGPARLLGAQPRWSRPAAASWPAAGLPLIYVQRQLGHASITTTQQVYGHLEESFLRGAPDRAERLIWAAADASDGADGAVVFSRAF